MREMTLAEKYNMDENKMHENEKKFARAMFENNVNTSSMVDAVLDVLFSLSGEDKKQALVIIAMGFVMFCGKEGER